MIKINNLTYNFDARFSAIFNFSYEFLDKKNYLIYSSQELESQTLFRILSKQYKNYSGEIFIDGKNLKSMRLKDLSVAYLTKTPFLLKNKSAKFNIAYPLILRGEKKSVAVEKASAILNEFNYSHISEKKVKQLDEKTQLIVSLLRAMIRRPQYVFADDIFFDEELLSLFKILEKNSNCFVATKNMNDVKAFKDYSLITF